MGGGALTHVLGKRFQVFLEEKNSRAGVKRREEGGFGWGKGLGEGKTTTKTSRVRKSTLQKVNSVGARNG